MNKMATTERRSSMLSTAPMGMPQPMGIQAHPAFCALRLNSSSGSWLKPHKSRHGTSSKLLGSSSLAFEDFGLCCAAALVRPSTPRCLGVVEWPLNLSTAPCCPYSPKDSSKRERIAIADRQRVL